MPAQMRAADHAGDQHDGERQRTRPAEPRPDVRGEAGAHHELPLLPDVDQAGPAADDRAEPDEQDRCRHGQREAPAARRPDAAVEHRLVDAGPRPTRRDDEQRGQRERAAEADDVEQHDLARGARGAIASRASYRSSSDSGSVMMRSPRTSLMGRAAHQQPEPVEVDVAARHLADDPPTGHHDDPVGEVEDLLQLGRDQQHGDAVGGGRRAAAPTCTRWRRRRGHASVGRRRAPAGCATARGPARRAAGCRPTATTSARRGSSRGCRSARSAASPARASSARSISPRPRHALGLGDEEVLGDGEVEHAAGVVAVLGDHGDTGRRHRAGPARRDRATVDLDASGVERGAGWTARRRARAGRCPRRRPRRRSRRWRPRSRTRRAAIRPSRLRTVASVMRSIGRATAASVTSVLSVALGVAARRRPKAERSPRSEHLAPDHRPGQRRGVAARRGPACPRRGRRA